jgi:hypothetical protein
MKLLVTSGGPRSLPLTELVLLTVAVLLMLGGAAMLIAHVVSAGISIALIAVGIALTVVVQNKMRRQHVPSR